MSLIVANGALAWAWRSTRRRSSKSLGGQADRRISPIPPQVRRLPSVRALTSLLGAATLLIPAGGATAQGAGSGWTRHAVSAFGFAIDTPSTWFDASSGPQRALDLAARTHPELASLVQWEQGDQLARLVCADRSGFPNVIVTVGNTSATLTLQELAAANIAQTKHLPYLKGDLSVAAVRLPAGPAVSVSYTEAPSQESPVEVVQYYLVHDLHAYVIAYTMLSSSDTVSRAIVTRSARTFGYTG
jgi:hypothetical protein